MTCFCQHCGQHIDAVGYGPGDSVECPSCSAHNVLPGAGQGGAPITVTKPVQIEQTAKIWKFMQLLGALVMCICAGGCVVVIVNTPPARNPDSLLPFAAFTLIGLFGMAIYIVGRICAWWRHG